MGMDLFTVKAERGPCDAPPAVADADTTAAEDAELSLPDSVTFMEAMMVDDTWVSTDRSRMGDKGRGQGTRGG